MTIMIIIKKCWNYRKNYEKDKSLYMFVNNCYSEEERIRLEERFKILVQESRNRHDACINRLRLRYIEFLEEQRTRDERNHKLLEALDRVDNSLALMTAKTDRLNVLRKQYEAYLRRIYTVPSPSMNINDDGNVTNQGEDRYLRRDVTVEQISPEVENTLSPRLLRLNGQKNRSISPTASKLAKSAQNMGCDYYQRNNAQSITLNQQINNKNILRSYSSIPQDNESIQQPTTQDISSQNFQQKRSYVQIDPNLHIPYVSPGRSCSLNQQTTSHFNCSKPLLEQMEIPQNMSQFMVPERTDCSMSQYKLLDVSPNRFAPMTLHYVHSSSVAQPFQRKSNRALLHDTETQTRSVDISPSEISSVYRTMPVSEERNLCGMSSLNKSPILSKQTSPRYFDYSWRKPDHFKSKHKSVSGTSVRPLTTSDVDNMIRRYKCFTPETSTNARLSMGARQSAEEDESRTATIVENELDRYIDKIRKLHRDLDAQSLEEIDQEQTMGDNMLNASLSDDNLSEILPGEDQFKENLPKKIEKVLALADDLASRSADLNVANEPGKERMDRNRNVDLVQTTKSGAPTSERNYVAFSDTRNGCKTSVTLAKDEISRDIILQETKLDPHQYIENSRKENLSNLSNTLEHYERQLPKVEIDDHVDFAVSSSDKVTKQDTKSIMPENIEGEENSEKDINIYMAAESNLNEYSFGTLEELEPWNMDVLQKRIREVDLTNEAKNQFGKTKVVIDSLNQDDVEQIESSNEIETMESKEDKKGSSEDSHGKDIDLNTTEDELKQKGTECLVSKEELTSKDEIEVSEASASQDQKEEYKDNGYTNNEAVIQNIKPAGDQTDEQNEPNCEQKQAPNEINPISVTAQDNEQDVMVQDYGYTNQNYYEDSNQVQNYTQNYEAEYTGLNEEYNYDQNASYENNQSENYDQNMSYNAEQKQNYDPNVSYETNQGENYNSNALYDTNEEQNYDLGSSYKTGQDQNYEQNVYEDNQNQNQEYQEYVNQEYMQGSNEQYGEYAGEQYGSENQYEHDTNMQYQEDANQQYAYDYDQQYETKQQSDTNINQSFACPDYDSNRAQLIQEEDKQNQEHKELQEEAKYEEAEGKVDTAQGKNEVLSSENGTKKKKDVIKSLLDSDTDSTIERNVSNTESDFDFN
ncbi:reticulocyte-binding protein 2 homolog a-like isoform X2 [Bombus vosnesenskii]|uniref:Reticulocyte-binding protein 2 homolog a-like isoform X2 n=1 Tax=Bombus vosnesenskii TaxID=207650 RepID=A0A6J3L746_9HYME|nr:reticulocyte-binding protein 2 homolog a-like isoform X2 [Bombus vosnesenskii]